MDGDSGFDGAAELKKTHSNETAPTTEGFTTPLRTNLSHETTGTSTSHTSSQTDNTGPVFVTKRGKKK